MTDHDLSDLLERVADRIPVSPPPLDELRTQATRRRRRRTVAVVMSSAAAVVVAMVGTAMLLPPQGTPRPPVAGPGVVGTPEGTRLVGIGHAAIAVPVSWGTNQTECGVPQRDTVVIDVGVIPLCATDRPEGVASVEVSQGPQRFDFVADQTAEIDGLAIERQDTTCSGIVHDLPSPDTGLAGTVTTCTGTVFIPSLSASFRAESSTDATTVDEILSWIRIVPDRVGIPGYQAANLETPQSAARDRYLAALRAEGLRVQVVTEPRPGVDAGLILDVSPAPGAMVPPGTVVTLTVVAGP